MPSMMMKSALAVPVLALVTFSPIRAQERRVLDLKIGAAAFMPLGGKQFSNTVLRYEYDRPTIGFAGGVRLHTAETTSIAIVAQWSRFGFTEVGLNMPDPRGTRRYVSVGLDLRRTWASTSVHGSRPFVGLGIGVAMERFTDAMFCKNSDGTRRTPCRDERSENAGVWLAYSMGAELPLGSRIRLEGAVSLDYVAMGSGGMGISVDDEGYWASFNIGMVANLW